MNFARIQKFIGDDPMMPLRIIGIILISALIIWWLEKKYGAVKKFFFAPVSDFNITALRFLMFGSWIAMFKYNRFIQLLGMPEDQWQPMLGPNLMLKVLPLNQITGWGMFVVMTISALLAMFNYRFKLTGSIALISGVYVHGMQFLTGKVDHWNHYIPLMSLVLLGHAFAVERLKTTGEDQEQSRLRINGFAVAAGITILSLAYYYPGVWKVGRGGIDWMMPANIRYVYLDFTMANNIYGAIPKWVFDQAWVFTFAALGGALWELFFPFAMLNKLTKWLFVGMGIFFHFANFFIININFLPLLMMYALFIPWDKIFGKVSEGVKSTEIFSPKSVKPLRNSLLVIVSMMTLMALPKIEMAWPVSCYPTFSRAWEDHRWITFAVEKMEDGTEVEHYLTHDPKGWEKYQMIYRSRIHELPTKIGENRAELITEGWDLFTEVNELDTGDRRLEVYIRKEDLSEEELKYIPTGEKELLAYRDAGSSTWVATDKIVIP